MSHLNVSLKYTFQKCIRNDLEVVMKVMKQKVKLNHYSDSTTMKTKYRRRYKTFAQFF